MTKKLNRIMLIDDDDDDNFFHRIVLEEIDAANNVQVATNGFEALEYLSGDNQIPDLIFLDINMPKMNGWEFLTKYSKLGIDQKAKVVIIMLSTSINPADMENAKRMSEITGFRTKPLTADMLKTILQDYFG
ncbi:MAG: response regulator [Chitinophagales bacterium]